MPRLRLLLIAVVALPLGLAAWVALEVHTPPAALHPAPPPRALRLDDVVVIGMGPGPATPHAGLSVLVVDDTIAAMGPTGTVAVPADLTADLVVVDGVGRTLVPGLIDAHVHVWDEAELAAYLAHGVTAVRNLSGMPWHLEAQAAIAAGELLGPDLATSGPILNSPGPNEQDIHALVTTAEAAREAVRAQHAAGFTTLKVYSNLTREAYEAALDETRSLGMTIVGHTPEGVRGPGVPFDAPFDIGFHEVLDDGFGTIEHVESIVWHGLSDQLDDDAMVALAADIAAAGVPVTTTLVAHANLVRMAGSNGSFADRPGIDTLNPLALRLEAGTRAFWAGQDPATREGPRVGFHQLAARRLHEAGVPLVAGSDAGIFVNVPGVSLHDELELLVQAGIPAPEVLRAATATAGPAIGRPDLGQVAPGFRANLLLVDGDPLADVTVLRRPAGVVVGGRWLDRAALDDLAEAARDTSEVRTAWRLLWGLP